ncbi:MAG: glycosyltransferase [Planctomycetaceae bacterium]
MSEDARLRLAFCVTELDPGGAERALVELVTRLDRCRFAPRVYCLSGRGALVDRLEGAGIETVLLRARSRADFGVVRRLKNELMRQRPQLLQTWLFHANLAGRLAGWWAGVPVIVSGIRVAERRSKWPLRLDRWTQRLVDAHVCVSQSVSDFSERVAGLERRKLRVIPNGVEAARFAEAAPWDGATLGIPPTAPVIVAAGRLDRQKGFDLLLRAIAAGGRFPRDPHWVVVGEGPERGNLQRQIADLGLQGTVHLPGWRADLPGILRAATGFVLSSRWEGMPNVVLEAMAAGLPVVATGVEGVRELVIDPETGWIVPPDDTAALTAALRALLADPAGGVQRGLAGAQRVRETFTWEQVCAAYSDMYSELCRERQLLPQAWPT